MPPRTTLAARKARLLGKRLRAARLEANMTQDDLAERSGVSAVHVRKIERGEGNPTLGSLVALADGVRTTVSELVDGL